MGLSHPGWKFGFHSCQDSFLASARESSVRERALRPPREPLPLLLGGGGGGSGDMLTFLSFSAATAASKNPSG